MSLRVLDPGLQSLIVDWGRTHGRSLGVPVGGAADRWSLAIGNAMVGNACDAPALEVALAGPALRADEETAAVVYGADFDIAADHRTLRPGKTFVIPAGGTLRIRGARRGVRGYLCVAGGFDGPVVMGSRSAFRVIQRDELLACRPSACSVLSPSDEIDSTIPTAFPFPLRFLPGAQGDWIQPEEFLSQEFIVSPSSNRMGLRLQGQALTRPTREMVSEPTCPGTVQLANDGQCIVLGVDGQTIGGYPKIAQVIRADLDFLGQLRPGDRVRFQPVSLEQAEHLGRLRRASLALWTTRIAVARNCTSVPDAPWL
jgi:antagonist of KipI